MVDMISKLPTLADDQLNTLRSNAERLEASGTPAQKKSATALLPALRAEIADRSAAKLAVVRENATRRRQEAQREAPPKRTRRKAAATAS